MFDAAGCGSLWAAIARERRLDDTQKARHKGHGNDQPTKHLNIIRVHFQTCKVTSAIPEQQSTVRCVPCHSAASHGMELASVPHYRLQSPPALHRRATLPGGHWLITGSLHIWKQGRGAVPRLLTRYSDLTRSHGVSAQITKTQIRSKLQKLRGVLAQI